MDLPVCCWERSLNWCMYHINTNNNSSPLTSKCHFCRGAKDLLHEVLLSPCSQLLFVVGFTVFLANCVDYDILFANKFVNHVDSFKVTLPDAFLPMDVCNAR